MRVGGEGEFDYLLVVESLNEAGAHAAGRKLEDTLRAALPGLRSCDSLVCKMIYGEAPYEDEVP